MTTDDERDGAGAGRLGATACWQALSDRLMSGLCHDVAGRATALLSALQIARRRPGQIDFVLGELEKESERLARAATGLQTFPRARNRPRETTSPATVLREAAGLLAFHAALAGVEYRVDVTADTPAVSARAGDLKRALLVLAAEAARCALSAGSEAVLLRARPADPGVAFTIEPLPAEPSVPERLVAELPPPLDAATLDALRDDVAREGGSLRQRPVAVGNAFEIVLPAARPAAGITPGG